MRRCLLPLLVGLLAPPLSAQGPLGPEFQVNTFTTDDQFFPSVSHGPGGEFVVVWANRGLDSLGFEVVGQRFTSQGALAGSEFQVNTFTTDYQYYPAVSLGPGGEFAVVWVSLGQDGSDSGIFGQRFTSQGALAGSEFQVNSYTTNFQRFGSVSHGPGGEFAVVWVSLGQDGSGSGVFGQRFTSQGTLAGSEFQVNTFVTGNQRYPSVSQGPSGEFAVVWTEDAGQDGSDRGIFGQRFTSQGAPAGSEFQINTFTTGIQRRAFVSHGLDGGFAVVWESRDQDGSGDGVFGQRFTSQGALAGSEFQINTLTTGIQQRPSVSHGPSEEFVVVWQSAGQDGSGYGVFGQRFTSQGALAGSEFQVNTFTTGGQSRAFVSHGQGGEFAVVWQSISQDGFGYGIFGQRFGLAPPTATLTETPTITATATITLTPTQTRTATVTLTPTQTRTATATPSRTTTFTVTETATSTSTHTPSRTPTITATATITLTPTQTGTVTATFTRTQTRTATATPSQTATFTATATATSTSTRTPSRTPTATRTPTVTPTWTPTPSHTPAPTNTRTPLLTRTPTPTPTSLPPGTPSPTPRPTPIPPAPVVLKIDFVTLDEPSRSAQVGLSWTPSLDFRFLEYQLWRTTGKLLEIGGNWRSPWPWLALLCLVSILRLSRHPSGRAGSNRKLDLGVLGAVAVLGILTFSSRSRAEPDPSHLSRGEPRLIFLTSDRNELSFVDDGLQPDSLYSYQLFVATNDGALSGSNVVEAMTLPLPTPTPTPSATATPSPTMTATVTPTATATPCREVQRTLSAAGLGVGPDLTAASKTWNISDQVLPDEARTLTVGGVLCWHSPDCDFPGVTVGPEGLPVNQCPEGETDCDAPPVPGGFNHAAFYYRLNGGTARFVPGAGSYNLTGLKQNDVLFVGANDGHPDNNAFGFDVQVRYTYRDCAPR